MLVTIETTDVTTRGDKLWRGKFKGPDGKVPEIRVDMGSYYGTVRLCLDNTNPLTMSECVSCSMLMYREGSQFVYRFKVKNDVNLSSKWHWSLQFDRQPSQQITVHYEPDPERPNLEPERVRF